MLFMLTLTMVHCHAVQHIAQLLLTSTSVHNTRMHNQTHPRWLLR